MLQNVELLLELCITLLVWPSVAGGTSSFSHIQSFNQSTSRLAADKPVSLSALLQLD